MILRSSESRYFKKKSIPYFFLLLCFFLLFINSLKAGQKNPINSTLPSSSISHSDSSFAPLLNPVFSDISSNPSFSYMMQNIENNDSNNHNFLFNLAGFIFSYSWIDNIYNYNNSSVEPANSKLFSVGKGFFFEDYIGFGINYSFCKSNNNNYNDYKSLTAGFLIRPVSFLSFGYVARDINNPEIGEEKTARTDIYSLSIRPFNLITLSIDASKYEGRKFEKSDILLSTSLRFKYDISAYAGFNIYNERRFSFGISLPIGIYSNYNAGLILDGYTSNINRARSSGFGITIAGERTSSIFLSQRFLKITLSGDISEEKTTAFFIRDKIIYYDFLNAIETAREDETIKAIILHINDTNLGFAQIQELREQIKKFRSKNKSVYAVLNTIGNKEYYIASACNNICYTPVNLFAITGLKAEVYFFKGVLDKIGIKIEAVSKGPYKSFPEPYTREHMSQEFRENLTALITDLNEQFLSDIASDRKISREQINNLLGKGVFTPEEAIETGFIDSLMYPMDAELKITQSEKLFSNTVDLNDYIDEKIRNLDWGPRPEIAVVYVSGSIVRGESGGYGNYSPKSIGDETYFLALQDAFKDYNVKAVVIRIDSGGGSSVASELMWHYLIKLKQEYNKPVIFSFGNIAASGGYYIACTGDRIISSRGSVTGSIGVFSGKLSFKELYAKLGINKDIIKMSEFADIFSEAKDMTPEERKVIEQGVDYIYKRFVRKVEEARSIPKSDIDKVTEGRIFTGSQARNNNLVDSFGGLLAAIEMASKTAGIKKAFNVRHLPKTPANILDLFGSTSSERLLSEKLKTLLKAIDLVDFKDEHALYYLPYKITIK